ncbi:MAG: diguanylate cyclase [Rhodomicrobium sp.]|nr:diguanylate cyclase [Rhodomicrobium sp.]
MASSTAGSPRARIAWISPDPTTIAAARPAFAHAGYALFAGSDETAADIAVVDLRQRRFSLKAAQHLAEEARRAAPDCGVVYLTSPALTASERAHLRRSGEIVAATQDYDTAIDVCRRRLRLRNIAEESGERLKSIAATMRLCEFPTISASSAPPDVLVAAPPGPMALSLLDAAERVSSRTIGAFNAAQAMRALEAGGIDCAVLAPQGEGDPMLALARSMRRHARFQDLPVVLIDGDDDFAPKGKGSSNVVERLSARCAAENLPARIVAASRRARLVSAMRRFLSACAGDGVRDRLSGSFCPQFFAQHAERLFARSDETGRPIAVVGLRLSSPANQADVGAAMTLTSAAQLINRVTRAEDFAARLSSDTFVILQSATQASDAEAAAKRIEGVIANTRFRSHRDHHPFAVAVASAASVREPKARVDETVASILGRLNNAVARTAER